MRRAPIHHWPFGNDSRRVDLLVGHVVVALDLVEVNRFAEAGALVQVAGVAPEVRVIDQPAQITLEVSEIDRVEAHQRGEQPDIGFGQLRTEQEALLRKPRLQPISRANSASTAAS